MKKLILALSLTLIIISFKTSAQKGDRVVFSGKIENATNTELILYDAYNKKSTLKVDGAGRFKDTVLITAVGPYRFYDVKNKLDIFFEKGKDLQVSYDQSAFETTVKFSGPGAAANNYIWKKEEIRKAQYKQLNTDTVVNPFMLSEAGYKEVYLGLKTALMKELSITPGLSDQYKRLEARNINYEYLFYLSQYEPVQINHLNKKNYKASKLLTDELASFDFTNTEDFLFSQMYRNIAESMYYDEAGRKSKADGTPRDIAHLKLVSLNKNVLIKDYLLNKFATSYLNYSTDPAGFYQAFMKGSSNEADKAKITRMYQAVTSVVANSVSPKFVNYENYAGGTSSLDDFKGKYVFIDVWATWCGPCIYEFPFLDTLENSYKGKNIQFVTVSIDTQANREKWRAFVKEKHLDGVQLRAENAFDSAFIKAYNINGIPRFLVIDPKGHIVSSNAPRPSDPALRKLLDSLPL
jgi:thiol-disulfide isomerase/thioredoxin